RAPRAWEPGRGDAPGGVRICRTLDRRTGAGPLYWTAGHEPGMDFRRRNHECAGSLRELPVPLRIRGHAGIDPFGEMVRRLPEALAYWTDVFRCDRGVNGRTVHLLH